MAKEPYLTFFGHLDELRRRIFVALIAVMLASVAGYLISDQAIRFLTAPLRAVTGEVYFFSPAGAFILKIKIAVFIGLIVASPVVLGQLWLFIAPGLRMKEKKFLVPVIAVTSLLFMIGAVFSFFAVIPFAMKFLVGIQAGGLKPMISAEEYLSFLTMMAFGFGVAFDLPVFILALVFAGLIDAAWLNRYQRHAIVLIFIAAAALTPGPDIASQLLLAFPLLFLFELSVLGAWIIGRRRKNAVRVRVKSS